jgi:RNA polymerase sigma-70 factor (ECF subfamily)
MAPEKLPLPQPFEVLMRRHEREIMRYLLHLAGDRENAADLFQETWLRAYRAYPRLRHDDNVRAWLYAIATNLSRNWTRDRARRERVIVPLGEQSFQQNQSAARHRSDDGDEAYAALRMRELIAELPAKQRQALHLRYSAGLDYASIALTMDCSEENARANVSQAVRKLRKRW